jgi:hypothetical protein
MKIQRLGLLAAALFAAVAPAVARADRLDNRLNTEMPAIVKSLKEKGYKNVGVLRFRVQRGEAKATFDPPLSGNLPTRVENFLVIHGGPVEKTALGVIHDAGPTAAKANISKWYSSPGDRRKLFDVNYRLAWGRDKVKPDVFLCGDVKVSKDVRKTTVTLKYFDKKNPTRLVELNSFTMNTDRDVLRDLGFSFGLSDKARVLMRGKRPSSSQADELVFEQMPKQPSIQPEKAKNDDPKNDDPKPDDPKPAPQKLEKVVVTPSNIGGVEVQMVVDGKSPEFRESSTEGDAIRWQIESPPQGAAVAFRLRNTSAKQLGVVLRLNGVSTIGEQKDEPERSRKWVIDPGKSYLVRGFYIVPETEARGKKVKKRGDDDGPTPDENPPKEKPEGKQAKYLPFKVLVGDEAKAAKEELSDKAGLIEVDVFEQGAEEQDMMVSGKGMPRSKEQKARESYVSLRSALLKAARLKTVDAPAGPSVVKREIIVVDKSATVEAPALKVVAFDNPTLVAHIAIKVVAPEEKVTPE